MPFDEISYIKAKKALNTIGEIGKKENLYVERMKTGTFDRVESASSTFSGWAGIVGSPQNFDTVAFYVRSFDPADPVTKVRCIIKTNDYFGTVLADKTFDAEVPTEIDHKLKLTFDSEIANTNDNILWLEFHTDGKTGFGDTLQINYPYADYPQMRYSTTGSTEDLKMVGASTERNMYVEFRKTNGHEYRATKAFRESVAVTDNYGKHFLREWQQQVSRYNDPAATHQTSIAIFGDSWVRGEYRAAKPLRDILTNKYGNAGLGYISLYPGHGANGDVSVSKTGTWNEIDNYPGYDTQNLDITTVESSEVGANVSVTINETTNNIDIYYKNQTGSFQYIVDGGTAVTVDTSLGNVESITGLSDANHTIDIEVVSGTVTLQGLNAITDDKGVIVHKIGNGGLTSGQAVSVNRTNWVNQLSELNPHAVGILLGTNDMAQDVTIEAFETNIIELIRRVREALPLGDVFLIAPSDNGATQLNTMEEYSEALKRVATSEMVAFVDLYVNVGSYADANARGLYEDQFHPNTQGGYLIGNVIHDRLLRV